MFLHLSTILNDIRPHLKIEWIDKKIYVFIYSRLITSIHIDFNLFADLESCSILTKLSSCSIFTDSFCQNDEMFIQLLPRVSNHYFWRPEIHSRNLCISPILSNHGIFYTGNGNFTIIFRTGNISTRCSGWPTNSLVLYFANNNHWLNYVGECGHLTRS